MNRPLDNIANDVLARSSLGDHALSLRAPTLISSSPTVYYQSGVLDAEDCAYLIECSRPALSASMVMTPAGGSRHDEEFRSSWTRFLNPDGLTPKEEDLLAKVRLGVGIRDDHALVPNIVRYREGGVFKLHYDYIFPSLENPNPRQRASTSIVFLNDDYDGGDTAFAKGGYAVRGRVGDALSFANVLADGALDPSSLHAGMPITRGEKWILVQWEKMLAAPI